MITLPLSDHVWRFIALDDKAIASDPSQKPNRWVVLWEDPQSVLYASETSGEPPTLRHRTEFLSLFEPIK